MYYFSGTRLGQIYHTRLRLSCSSLHHHLFLKNIINDPLCECGAVEDTNHFFFICDRFRNLRHVLLNTISTFCQPTLEVILYGSTDISVEENKQIFLAVHEFILKTKRFFIKKKKKKFINTTALLWWSSVFCRAEQSKTM